jgi:hypothetical protein
MCHGIPGFSVLLTDEPGCSVTLLPRLPNTHDLREQWPFLIPRPQFGAMIDAVGKTSYGHAGVVCTGRSIFLLEPMFGGAVHDGNASAVALPDENTLGCRVPFHTAMSGGYRLTRTLDGPGHLGPYLQRSSAVAPPIPGRSSVMAITSRVCKTRWLNAAAIFRL